jgi:hypothetical protein
MLPTQNFVDRPKTKRYRVDEDNSQNMYFFYNQRLSRACIVHLVIKRTNWSYVKTMSCSGSHLGITINIKKHKVCKGPSND